MPSVAEIFGTTLRRIRTQRGITQKELGAKTRMSHTFIGEMERGLKAPNLNAVIALADALNAGVEELMSDFIRKPPPRASREPPSPPRGSKPHASARGFAGVT